MTDYKIIYELSNRIITVIIQAHSPMEAFRKFKEMMPKVVYNNLSLINVDPGKVKKQEQDLCIPCVPAFDKLKVVAKPVENYLQNEPVKFVRPRAEYSNNRKYDLI